MLATYDYFIGGTLPSLFTGWFVHGGSVQPAGYKWRYLSSNSSAPGPNLSHPGIWALTGLTPGPLQLDFAALYAGVTSCALYAGPGGVGHHSPVLLQAFGA